MARLGKVRAVIRNNEMDKAQHIKQERKRRGLSQRQVAAMARVAQRTYARYEAGHRDMPDAVYELLLIKFAALG